MQLRVLSEAGFDLTRAATSLGALSLLGVAGLLALPAVAAPFAVATGSTGGQLEPVLVLGLVLLALVIAIIAVLLTHDTPIEAVASGIQWLTNRVRPNRRRSDPPTRVLRERDAIRTAFGTRPMFVVATIARTTLDCSALYLSLRAAGAHVSAAASTAAFVASNIAGLVPLTPGGLGFVESGLAHIFTMAGATRSEARVAIATYRLAATWLPCLAGFAALVLFRRRHRPSAAPTVAPDEATGEVPAGALVVPS